MLRFGQNKKFFKNKITLMCLELTDSILCFTKNHVHYRSDPNRMGVFNDIICPTRQPKIYIPTTP